MILYATQRSLFRDPKNNNLRILFFQRPLLGSSTYLTLYHFPMLNNLKNGSYFLLTIFYSKDLTLSHSMKKVNSEPDGMG